MSCKTVIILLKTHAFTLKIIRANGRCGAIRFSDIINTGNLSKIIGADDKIISVQKCSEMVPNR